MCIRKKEKTLVLHAPCIVHIYISIRISPFLVRTNIWAEYGGDNCLSRGSAKPHIYYSHHKIIMGRGGRGGEERGWIYVRRGLLFTELFLLWDRGYEEIIDIYLSRKDALLLCQEGKIEILYPSRYSLQINLEDSDTARCMS